MDNQSKNNKIGFGIAGVLVLGLISFGMWSVSKKETDEALNTIPVPNNIENPIDKNSLYKDGVYREVVTYIIPSGSEKFGVNVTLKGDIVTAVDAEMLATNETAVKFQQDFISNFKPMVIGKKIDDIQLDKVSGSSLTPKAFNDAINKIKVTAQAS